jgi:hypothetical protein
MRIKFYVVKYDSSLFACFLTAREDGDTSYELGKKPIQKALEDPRVTKVDSYEFHSFLNELQTCRTFHRSLACEIKRHNSPFVIKLTPNKTEFIDKTW